MFYVKTLADMASKPNASVAVQTDWVVIQSWLGRRDRPSPLRSWIGFAWSRLATNGPTVNACKVGPISFKLHQPLSVSHKLLPKRPLG